MSQREKTKQGTTPPYHIPHSRLEKKNKCEERRTRSRNHKKKRKYKRMKKKKRKQQKLEYNAKASEIIKGADR